LAILLNKHLCSQLRHAPYPDKEWLIAEQATVWVSLSASLIQ